VAAAKNTSSAMEGSLNQFIDHTILKPTTTVAEVEQVCDEAIKYDFAAVCIPPLFCRLARQLVVDAPVKVATVVGFPFGYSAIEAKVSEIVLATVDGADELDIVINISAIKNNDWNFIANEINIIMPIVKASNTTLKVIIESGILTDDEIIRCCDIYGLAGVDYVKTSTGYAEKGASVHAVRLMRAHLSDQVKIKASGGIKTYVFAKELIDAGASRLGCSSSVQIMKEMRILHH
jgi:deoxyribose-phosphate aldolase